MPTFRNTLSVPSSEAGYDVKYGRLEEDPFLYRGQGLLEVVGPVGRGAAGSGRFRVGEQVWRGEA